MGRITGRAGAVILLYDRETLRVADRKRVTAEVSGKNTIVAKENWMLVVMAEQEEPRQLVIKSSFYEKETIQITMGKNKPEVYRIWLTPVRPQQWGDITGACQPFSRVNIIQMDTVRVYRLMEDISPGADEISIYHIEGEELEGRQFVVEDESTGVRETVQVEKRVRGNYGYFIKEKIVNAFKRETTRIYIMNVVYADSLGYYSHRLLHLPEQGSRCRVIAENVERDITIYRERI